MIPSDKTPTKDRRPMEMKMDTGQKLDLLADLIIDRFLEDKKNNKLKLFSQTSNIIISNNNNGTPNYTNKN